MPYTIFTSTLCDGNIPILHDGNGRAIVFSNRREAEKEHADHMVTQYQQVVDGERELEEVDDTDWVDEIEVDGFGKLKGWSEEYIFDSKSYEAVRAITDPLPMVSALWENEDCDTPYEIRELISGVGGDGWFVNVITRYAKKPRECDDVVGWAIEVHNPDLVITEEVEILDAGVVVAVVEWLRAAPKGPASDHDTLMAIRDRLSASTLDSAAARDVVEILLRAGFNLIDPTTEDLYPAP